MRLTKKQEYELLASISARGEIPTKFIYLVENGADIWDRVYRHRSSKTEMSGAEMGLLMAHIDSFINVFSEVAGINLIDLGCGNGLPAIQIIRQLKRHKFDITYTAVDISSDMIDLAAQNLKEEFKNLKMGRLLVDFEKESLTDNLLSIKQQNNYPSFLVDLGNTLGNHVNANSVLTNFLESMTTDDYLLIGNGLANEYNPQKILGAYDVDLLVEIATGPARSLGIYDDNDDFKYIWNPNKNRVEGRLRLSREKIVKLAGQDLHLNANEELLVLQSYKFSETSLTKLLSETGFRTELLTTTKDRSHILTMVQPTRYSVA